MQRLIASRLGVPDRFVITLVLALGFMAFVTVDQTHWWRLKPDYAFGWLVPVFVLYVVKERWAQIRALVAEAGSATSARPDRKILSALALAVLFAGALVFLMGAIYRAGSGPTQPGSFALACGFACVLPALVFFNVPDGQLPDQRGLGGSIRLRVTLLFAFPAVIWLLSAPLVTAVENALSLFLLRRVVTVVYTVFNTLGFPMIQEGNVLVLPRGRVGVVDACSGIRSLMGCLFAGSFLSAVFLNRFWKKALLVAAALGLAFSANLVRSLFLTAWAYAHGSEAIEGDLHDWTGFAVLGITVVVLFALLALFRRSTWRRMLGWLTRRTDHERARPDVRVVGPSRPIETKVS